MFTMQQSRFDAELFLRDYWQKKPLVIRNPWKEWNNPLSPHEFAALACEEEVEARVVRQIKGEWSVQHGPFSAAALTTLADERWTLLIQAADHYIAEVAALIDPFRFIPSWRIDDVMVSYATCGGGVGPHFDRYDVFLVQGLGQRRWQIGQLCDSNTACLPHEDLHLLAEFVPQDEWLLEPGDILYLPPFVAHNGVAVGDDCMTYSIGFRAPSQSELIANWTDDVLENLTEDHCYEDPDLAPQDHPGEISTAALHRLHAMVAEKIRDRAAFSRWFGQYSSTPKYPDIDWSPQFPLSPAELRSAAARGAYVYRNTASRFSFIREDAGRLLLFADGQCFDCAGPAASFAEQICRNDRLLIANKWVASAEAANIIRALYNRGSITIDEAERA